MNSETQLSVRPSSPRAYFVFACTLVVILVAAIVLAGWFFDISQLKSALPGFSKMKPNTAVGFLIAALGLIFAAKRRTNEHLSHAAVFCGVMVYLLGSLTLGEYITGSSFGIDTLLVPAADIGGADQFSGRMSPQSAFNFTVLGISLVLLHARRLLMIGSEFLALILSVATFGSALGYLYGAEQLYGITNYNRMALHTAVLFFICSFALLAANDESRTVRLLTADSLGGTTARRMMPMVILVPTVVGWLWVLGQQHSMYDEGFGATLTIFSCVVLMFGIVLFFSGAVHRVDRLRKTVEEKLVEKEQRYRDLFEYGQSMICIHDLDGVLTTVNPAALHCIGYSSDEVIGMNLQDFIPEGLKPQFPSFLRQIRNEGISSGTFALIAKSGKQIVWQYQSILVSETGKEPYVLGNAQDITKLVEATDQLKNLSLTDELTGLYNRRGFLTLAEQQIKLERHEKTARGLTLMFADMDDLKPINDRLGHEAGSDALKELSKILKSVLRSSDLIARWGGDEFVILAIGTQDENVDQMSQRITDRIKEYNAESEKSYQLSCSVGIAPIPLDGERSFESLIAEADEAMYVEKRRRKADRDSITNPPPAARPQTNLLRTIDLTNRGPSA